MKKGPEKTDRERAKVICHQVAAWIVGSDNIDWPKLEDAIVDAQSTARDQERRSHATQRAPDAPSDS